MNAKTHSSRCFARFATFAVNVRVAGRAAPGQGDTRDKMEDNTGRPRQEGWLATRRWTGKGGFAMSQSRQRFLIIASLWCSPAAQAAAEVTLNQVTFLRSAASTSPSPPPPRPRPPRSRPPSHQQGQAVISLKFRDMKPAILYGGDVTSYVLWAVNREGGFENLGELWVRTADDELEFSTGMKSFALMVTAEAYTAGRSPATWRSSPPPSEDKQAPNTPFASRRSRRRRRAACRRSPTSRGTAAAA
jgi:hypothetical protein